MTCVQESTKPNLDLTRENRQVGTMLPNRLTTGTLTTGTLPTGTLTTRTLTTGTLKIGPDKPFPDLLLNERFYRTLPATGFLVQGYTRLKFCKPPC